METASEEDNDSVIEIQGELSTTEVKEEVDDDDTVIGFEMEEAEIATDVPQTPDAFMLPALVDQRTEIDTTRRNRRFAGQGLLNTAHQQILRGTSGLKDIAGRAHEAGRRKVVQLQEKPPLCFVIAHRAYHKYGLKHVILILVFLLYTTFGASVFLLVEKPYQSRLKNDWSKKMETNRNLEISFLMNRMFNNSDYLVYIKGTTTERLKIFLQHELDLYEQSLGVRWSDQRLEWDFYTALLFAGTICTTIGYGHIYPMTTLGRVFTMIFALFGIPLVLLVLQDVGQMLTFSMKYPWFQTKRLTRRVLRCFTKQSLREMREIEELERRNLRLFDLPIVVGVSLIVGWVFLCSFFLSQWDQNWTLFESCYFFFISLSTIGLGDLVPSSPKLLLTMFWTILIGLSLVSMVLNLLQQKMRKTYEAGQEESHLCIPEIVETLDEDEKKSISDRSLSRSTQTSLSLPGVKQVVLRSDGVHWVSEIDSPKCKSPDEVTRLVEMESGLQVCEQIGENNNDEEHDEMLVNETDVLLEREEESD